jgi:outer membrane scaffolding protein for murein synthesis (MipA/OmpV family)
MESKMKKLILMALVLSVLLLTGTAWATKGIVGLGVGMAPDYEGSDDTTGIPMFMFNHNYDSGRFVRLMGPNMKVNLLTNKEFSLGPVLNYRMGRDDVDNKRVDAMKDLDDAVEAGVFAGLDMNNWLLGVEVLFDVSDEHDGKIAQGTLAYRWKATQDLTITPGAFVTWADGSYMDHYFGVSTSNVGTSGLPLYDASSGIKDIGLNVAAHYTPWENWGVMGIISYKSLLDDAEDSPVVDIEGDDKQMMIGVMATYRWGQ